MFYHVGRASGKAVPYVPDNIKSHEYVVYVDSIEQRQRATEVLKKWFFREKQQNDTHHLFCSNHRPFTLCHYVYIHPAR